MHAYSYHLLLLLHTPSYFYSIQLSEEQIQPFIMPATCANPIHAPSTSNILSGPLHLFIIRERASSSFDNTLEGFSMYYFALVHS